eukprot:scaffold234666_cov19-Prasinocladus_malaysianus.AAC.1
MAPEVTQCNERYTLGGVNGFHCPHCEGQWTSIFDRSLRHRSRNFPAKRGSMRAIDFLLNGCHTLIARLGSAQARQLL